jgi:hypothetical protein
MEQSCIQMIILAIILMLMTKLAAFWQEFLKAIMKSRYVVIHTFSPEEQKKLKEKTISEVLRVNYLGYRFWCFGASFGCLCLLPHICSIRYIKNCPPISAINTFNTGSLQEIEWTSSRKGLKSGSLTVNLTIWDFYC